MTNYIIRRLIQLVVILLLLSFFCYGILNLMPGDPLDILIASNPDMTMEDIARLKELYGVNKSVYIKYFNWLSSFVKGDMGYSRTYNVPTEQILVPRLINTFFLSAGALFLSIILAIPLGILAGLKKGTKIDYGINLFAFSGISVPSFWLAILLMIVFSVYLRWFPAGGTESIALEKLTGWAFFKDRMYYMTLPMLSLMGLQMGIFVRFARATIIEVMQADFIRTARAKGLAKRRIVMIHAFKNASIPLITMISISSSYIFSGAIITETIFAYQGVGKLVYDSIIGNDFNVAMVSFIITIAMVLLFNLIADISYAIVDPRIKYK